MALANGLLRRRPGRGPPDTSLSASLHERKFHPAACLFHDSATHWSHFKKRRNRCYILRRLFHTGAPALMGARGAARVTASLGGCPRASSFSRGHGIGQGWLVTGRSRGLHTSVLPQGHARCPPRKAASSGSELRAEESGGRGGRWLPAAGPWQRGWQEAGGA